MSLTANLVSSPIKDSGPPMANLTASKAQDYSRDRMLVSSVSGKNFVDHYLQSSISEWPDKWTKDQARLIQNIQNTKDGSETTLYASSSGPLLDLLNSISLQAHQSRDVPNEPALIFSSHDKRPINTPYPGHSQKPDVVATWGDISLLQQTINSSDSSRPSESPTWYKLVTVGEVKLERNGCHQIGNYVRHLLRHHPELNATLGFFACRKGYQLVYHDASDIQISERFLWSPAPIYAFVYKLYEKPFRDETTSMLDPNSALPSWAIRVEDEVFITKSARPELGPGQRRFTSLAIHIVTATVVFIKDVWRDVYRRYFEGLMYAKAHAANPMAGLMILEHHGYVQNKLGEQVRTTDLNAGPNRKAGVRYKMRITTRDIGRPLNDIKKLSRFLRVMYDACVVQRNLYRKCKILHRDISDTNIMLAPDSEEYRERCATGYAEVKFINQVLSKNSDEKPDPACLIIDLGNGADLMELGGQEALAERTGTPKFIARSVSCGELLDLGNYKSDSVNMPYLEGKSLELYQRTCGATYDYYNRPPSRAPELDPNPTFVHQLFHDAESTFWVIAWTLARSAGENYQQESTWNADCKKFVDTMREQYPASDNVDKRLALPSSESKWRSILHEDLQCLAPMLSRMFSYVRPEWAYRNELDPEHVHEAIMRLLLSEIVRLEENNADIPLAVGVRSLPPSMSLPYRSQSSASFSTDLQVPCSRTQSSHDITRPLLVERASSDGSRRERKRKNSHPDQDLARRVNPRLTSRRTPEPLSHSQPKFDTFFIDQFKDELQKIQWGRVGHLQEPANSAPLAQAA
ncbi:hypothetical protein RhiJN_05350 [Ceratobasidium sp. AG-Ba]|nr:hypothetical protein RhiJN_05350 [Ceratobasidium sp. AG-Ba]QRW06269.1 hypothetical protein RhiLY_05268 [Ceratobasidium sp. AG-Ba]